MKRKIRKYDIIVLREKASGCWMGDYLVLSIKPEAIKLFSLRARTFFEYDPKHFLKKYEVKFYG